MTAAPSVTSVLHVNNVILLSAVHVYIAKLGVTTAAVYYSIVMFSWQDCTEALLKWHWH